MRRRWPSSSGSIRCRTPAAPRPWWRRTIARRWRSNARNRTTPPLVSITTSGRRSPLRALHVPRSDQPGVGRQPARVRDAQPAAHEQSVDVLVHADLRHVDCERAARRPCLQQQSDRRAAERVRRHFIAGTHRPRSGAAGGQRHPQDRVPRNGASGSHRKWTGAIPAFSTAATRFRIRSPGCAGRIA